MDGWMDGSTGLSRTLDMISLAAKKKERTIFDQFNKKSMSIKGTSIHDFVSASTSFSSPRLYHAAPV
jgi:hypothetical protein